MIENVCKQVKLRWMNRKPWELILMFLFCVGLVIRNIVSSCQEETGFLASFGQETIFFFVLLIAKVIISSTKSMTEDQVRMYPGTVMTRFLGRYFYDLLQIFVSVSAMTLAMTVIELFLRYVGVRMGWCLYVHGDLLQMWGNAGLAIILILALYTAWTLIMVYSRRTEGWIAWGIVVVIMGVICLAVFTPSQTGISCIFVRDTLGGMAAQYMILTAVSFVIALCLVNGQSHWLEQRGEKDKIMGAIGAGVLVYAIMIACTSKISYVDTEALQGTERKDIEKAVEEQSVLYEDKFIPVAELTEASWDDRCTDNDKNIYYYTVEQAKECGLVGDDFKLEQGKACVRKVVDYLTLDNKCITKPYVKNDFLEKTSYPILLHNDYMAVFQKWYLQDFRNTFGDSTVRTVYYDSNDESERDSNGIAKNKYEDRIDKHWYYLAGNYNLKEQLICNYIIFNESDEASIIQEHHMCELTGRNAYWWSKDVDVRN